MKNKFNIPIPSELDELAKLFHDYHKNIYIVGGYIRDFVASKDICMSDIDICSECLVDEVIYILKGSKFSIRNINRKYGTLKLITQNGEIYEYATFRKEQYNNTGEHYPILIEFTKELSKDCVRRDFTCNSIYYDIYNRKIIDTFNGLEDIENKIIKTTRDPKIVFREDCERILRMLRISSDLNFKIDIDTYEVAKSCSKNLKNLSKTRMQREISKITNNKKLNKDKILKDFNIEI